MRTLTVTPDRILIDQTATIQASGLRPGESVKLRASLSDGDGQTWKSETEFVADSQGGLDLSKQAPTHGSYSVVSPMGPVWSMKPADKGVNVYHLPHHGDPEKVHFDLLRGDATIAQADLQQDQMSPGIRQIHVNGNLHGMFFLPQGDGPKPAVLVLGGSEGGLPFLRGAWLASHGYVAFALAYFRYEGVPTQLEAIPLEYFGAALAWMKQRPEIDPNHIAVMGSSRGGELALQLGALYPDIKAVVAYVPSNVRRRACCGDNAVPYAWTLQGKPLAWIGGNEHDPEAVNRASIAVERIGGPVLMIGGQQDHVWESSRMVSEAAARLRRSHFPYEVDTLIYPHAGHIAGRPEIVPEWHGQLRHPVSGKPTDFGGSPEGNALSSIDAIPKVLDFLQRSLRQSTATDGGTSP